MTDIDTGGFDTRPGERVLAEAQFDENALRYYVLVNTINLSILVVLICIPLAFVTFGISLIGLIIPAALIGVTRWYYGRYYGNLRCVLTNRALRVRTGVWNVSEKAIPLDKITDLQMNQGWIMRRFEIEKVAVETAGQSSTPGGSLVSLVGITESRSFRERVLEQRDVVVGSAEETTPTAAASVQVESVATGVVADGDVVGLLTEIRDTLREIRDRPGV